MVLVYDIYVFCLHTIAASGGKSVREFDRSISYGPAFLGKVPVPIVNSRQYCTHIYT